MKEELLKGLSEEQIAKVKSCSSGEEIFAAAKQEGIELTDEQLAAVSGVAPGGLDQNGVLGDEALRFGVFDHGLGGAVFDASGRIKILDFCDDIALITQFRF